jgi:predicted PurR-regulated permease PerM
MYFSLVVFLNFSILLIFGAPTDSDQVHRQLTNILKHLNRIELQLNNSINHLLEKMNENSDYITDLIKSKHDLPTDSEFSFSTISKNST